MLAVLAVAVFALNVLGSNGLPNLRGQMLDESYARLRSMGYRVEVGYIYGMQKMPLSAFHAPATVARMHPAPGTSVKPGGVVTLYGAPGDAFDVVGRADQHHRARVPDFVGRRVSTALHWLDAGHWWVNEWIPLPRLPASNAPSLYAAYRVTAQRPAAGSELIYARPGHDDLTLTVVPVGG